MAPGDDHIFGPDACVDLCSAVSDMSMLLTRGYPLHGTLKLVGDRYDLTDRQRLAVRRCSCSDAQRQSRQLRRVDAKALKGECLIIDGFNLLITVEAALSGAAVFIGRDGCYRDLSGIHGSYRRVTETPQAFAIIADYLKAAGVGYVKWLFDRPVSNSGKLKVMVTGLAEANGWPWEVQVVDNPDNELIAADDIVSTSDSDVIDRCAQWFNLCEEVVNICKQSDGSGAFVVDLSRRFDDC